MRKVLFVSSAVALLVAFTGSAAQADILDGLVAHWKLDETAAGPVVNEVGTNGTNNGATIGQPGEDLGGAALGGYAYLFDRSASDYVDTNLNNVIPATGDFSLFAWINTTSHTGVGTDYAGYIFSNYTATLNGRSAMQVGNGNFGFFINSNVLSTTAPNVSDGEWHHVGVTRESGAFNLWVDGTPTAVSLSGSISTGTNNWRIGGPQGAPGSGQTRFFNGLIDDVRVYDRALTASDVAKLAPEPSSFLLLALGLLVGLSRRRRRS